MCNRASWKITVILMICVLTAIAAPAQTFKTLVNFKGSNGSFPGHGFLVQGLNGNLYGTTLEGGTKGDGAVFEVTPEGKITVLYNFCSKANCIDGESPQSGLLLATNGDFYGTTYSGGLHGQGTVFEITPAGKLTTLYSFCSEANCADGQNPKASLIQATDGNFYGTTFQGGNANSAGTFFRITPAGKLTTLHSFCSNASENCPDGAFPVAALVQAANGKLYGSTSGGGGQKSDAIPKASNPCAGNIFSDGVLGLDFIDFLDEFCNAIEDGASPQAAMAIAGPPPPLSETSDGSSGNGNLYGTASGGPNLSGIVFEMTPAGKLSRLYSFCSKANCADGAFPSAGLSLGADGNFYGTTTGGNGNSECANLKGCGIVFQLTPKGVLSTLHNFDKTDGGFPMAGLVQATSGIFYGTTSTFGADGDGTIFSVSTGLGPFVATVPASAIQGETINILGQDFTSASKVKFGNLQAAKVTLNGAHDLIATVPKGALTAAVTVTTGSITLTSNLPFGVLPDVSSFSPTSGAEGKSVTITGSGLRQTVAVAFGDVQATDVKIISDTEVSATVPSGAKTGRVAVQTQGGTGVSAKNFTVD